MEGYGLFERVSDAIIRMAIKHCITCNPSKCKELAFMKKGNAQIFDRVAGIPQVKYLVLLGLLFSPTPDLIFM